MVLPAFIVPIAMLVAGFAGLSLQAAGETGVWPAPTADGQISGINGQASATPDQVSGISGTVYRLSGNHMPAPNRRPRPIVDSARTSGARTPSATTSCADSPTAAQDASRTGARTGVKSTVCIFELTSDNQVVRAGSGNSGAINSPYYQAVLTHLIRQIETDDQGHFQVVLPPGTYSVFTKKGNLFYATQRDEKNNIAPVKVLPGKITRIQCSVESDHKVVY